jgi:hypothetical protein
MARLVLGMFGDRMMAESAIGDLEELGFNPKDISIVMRDRAAATEMATDTGASVASGAATGATTGGVLGALAGLLVGIGAITIPGLGALFIAGPIATALGLTGAAATTVSGALTGAVAGGLVGGLMGLGVPEEDARYYEDRIREGGILLAVPTEIDQDDEVRHILQDNGADQIRSIDEITPSRGYDRGYADTHAQAAYFEKRPAGDSYETVEEHPRVKRRRRIG